MVLAFIFGISFVSCNNGKTKSNDNNDADNEDSLVADDSGYYQTEYDVPGQEPDCCAFPDIDTTCNIEDNIVTPNPDYPAYFAAKAIGLINDGASTSSQTMTFTTKVVLKLVNYPEKTILSPRAYYTSGTLTDGSPTIILSSIGDKGNVGHSFGTIVENILPVADLQSLKDAGITEFTGGVPTQVLDIIYLDPVPVVKQCVIAITAIDEAGTAFVGNGVICTDKNVAFAVGETMKLGVNLKLEEDKKKIMEFYQVATEAELCKCADLEGTPVDCPETTDEILTTDE